MKPRIGSSAAAALLALASPMALAPTAHAEPAGSPWPTPSAQDIAASVQPLDLRVAALEEGSITALEQESTDGEETVISLSSDILFGFDSATLPENPEAKIEQILADAPEGATLKVEGHTDSRGTAEYNQTLSEDRAQAVADVIAEVRPDLTLEVAGFGMDRPIADNTIGDEDNPEGRALNRRVELRFADEPGA
ncbi:MAG: OmpA family protein [Actinomycetia bacterium]|nr:OmpA family protein [Actinomycetes bacterium]